jgi:hypothetical protein
MAFSLTAFQARSLEIQSPSYKKGIQQAVLTITGTAADVDLDVGDVSGTFWTAALANTTYGTLASKALDILTKISDQSVSCLGWKCQQLMVKVQSAAAGSAGEYAVSYGTIAPNFAIHTGEGSTAYYLVLEYEMANVSFPIIANYVPQP